MCAWMDRLSCYFFSFSSIRTIGVFNFISFRDQVVRTFALWVNFLLRHPMWDHHTHCVSLLWHIYFLLSIVSRGAALRAAVVQNLLDWTISTIW
ncbi:hypothetical protein F9C07_1384090 [Aspergillus flavus]|uniref:Uncharacterized protein n=1 Tax=Aspergillus flavus (strain ATCC 200026 / FGSC A1120 / IAM 13836 / NRRL 3357 / JCM 12722 / SRRC 167) TaxID=332952 RepID=A0A7U2ML14_ASPFN|nr:hypothetical protein F9C07_1384090 [Aspergillus flavus]